MSSRSLLQTQHDTLQHAAPCCDSPFTYPRSVALIALTSVCALTRLTAARHAHRIRAILRRELQSNKIGGVLPAGLSALRSLAVLCVARRTARAAGLCHKPIDLPWRRTVNDNYIGGTMPPAVMALPMLELACAFAHALAMPTRSPCPRARSAQLVWT